MGVVVGSTNVPSVYVGSTPVDSVYAGTSLVYRRWPDIELKSPNFTSVASSALGWTEEGSVTWETSAVKLESLDASSPATPTGKLEIEVAIPAVSTTYRVFLLSNSVDGPNLTIRAYRGDTSSQIAVAASNTTGQWLELVFTPVSATTILTVSLQGSLGTDSSVRTNGIELFET
jgi:hypothetical protein